MAGKTPKYTISPGLTPHEVLLNLACIEEVHLKLRPGWSDQVGKRFSANGVVEEEADQASWPQLRKYLMKLVQGGSTLRAPRAAGPGGLLALQAISRSGSWEESELPWNCFDLGGGLRLRWVTARGR